MFRSVQLVNSSTADKTIARVAVRQAAGNPALAELVRQYQAALKLRDNARLDLVAENAKPNEERKADRLQRLDAALKAASANADALLLKVQQGFPDYAKLADPGPAALADVQAQLGNRDAFLEFVIGVKSGFALFVTHDGLTAQPLRVTSEGLSGDIAALRRAFVPKLGHPGEFSLKTAFALYQQLLGPLEPSLNGVDHLIVAPGGDLASLPLSLLVTSEPTGGYENAAWLIRRMAISQVPSPRAFLALRSAARVTAPRPFFGVGNPTFVGGAASGRALNALASVCQRACRSGVVARLAATAGNRSGGRSRRPDVEGAARLDPAWRKCEQTCRSFRPARAIPDPLLRHPRHAARRIALPGRTGPGPVAAIRSSCESRVGWSAARERNREPEARRRSCRSFCV
jgi:hypothetical protein